MKMADQLLNSELQNKINLYFDNALCKEDEIELMKGIKNNSAVKLLFNEERAFRMKIRDGLSRTIASPTLVNAIRSQFNAV